MRALGWLNSKQRTKSFSFLESYMGKSKKDLSRMKANLKAKLAELEAKARKDPLKKNKALHEELASIRKKLED